MARFQLIVGSGKDMQKDKRSLQKLCLDVEKTKPALNSTHQVKKTDFGQLSRRMPQGHALAGVLEPNPVGLGTIPGLLMPMCIAVSWRCL